MSLVFYIVFRGLIFLVNGKNTTNKSRDNNLISKLENRKVRTSVYKERIICILRRNIATVNDWKWQNVPAHVVSADAFLSN